MPNYRMLIDEGCESVSDLLNRLQNVTHRVAIAKVMVVMADDKGNYHSYQFNSSEEDFDIASQLFIEYKSYV